MSNVRQAYQRGRLPGAPTWIFISIWFGVIAWLSQGGYLRAAGGPPTALLTAIFTPLVLFWLGYLATSGFRKWVLELDLAFLVAVQSWRVVGIALIFLWAFGLLPGGFALPAGGGDVAVGILAVFGTLRIQEGSPMSRPGVMLLSILGLADFVFALWAANFAGPTSIDPLPAQAAVTAGILTRLPLSMVAGFLVPVFSCAHFAALLNLRQRQMHADPDHFANDAESGTDD